jgi:hypothetical protein
MAVFSSFLWDLRWASLPFVCWWASFASHWRLPRASKFARHSESFHIAHSQSGQSRTNFSIPNPVIISYQLCQFVQQIWLNGNFITRFFVLIILMSRGIRRRVQIPFRLEIFFSEELCRDSLQNRSNIRVGRLHIVDSMIISSAEYPAQVTFRKHASVNLLVSRV